MTSFSHHSKSHSGIMSVTDIEVTMNEEVTRQHAQTRQIPEQENTSWPIPACTLISCDENSCLWHRCILKLPQHVKWQDHILTVSLERNSTESFGFNHKAKQHQGKNDLYILVAKVDKDGKAARNGLRVGDLILSVNQTPLQSKDKLSEINFKSLDKLRLQIQRPAELTDKARPYIPQLIASMEANRSTPIPGVRMPQPVSPSTSPSANDFNGLSPVKENIPLSTLPKSIKPKNQLIKLPQVRVFVCGNATNEFLRSLLGSFINIKLESRTCCFQISMKKLKNGPVVIGNSESFTYLLREASDTCINVELVAISDENFFHHCCSWMFSDRSIFILTFDTKRLSQSSNTELSRLCSLAHTIRTSVPGGDTIRTYGVSSGADSTKLEETETLFYTSLGQLLPRPRVISPVSDSQDMNQTRLDIYNLLSTICDRQSVTSTTAIALDILLSQRAYTTSRSVLVKHLEERDTSERPKVEAALLLQVIEDLKNTGNLLVTGGRNVKPENDKEFIVPIMMFETLSLLSMSTEKDRVSMSGQNMHWKLCTTGIVTRPEMLEILTICDSDTENLLACMENLHLIFPVHLMYQDSGFEDGSSILFPFFLEDIPFDPTESYEKYAVVNCAGDVPSVSYYSLLSELSQSEGCQSFKMEGQFVAHLIMNELDIYIIFLKTDKQIQLYRKRTGRSRPSKNVISSEFQQILRRNLPCEVTVTLCAEEVQQPTSGLADCEPGQCQYLAPSIGAVSFDATPLGATPAADNPLPLNLEVGDQEEDPHVMNSLNDMEIAQNAVLNMRVVDLRFVHSPLHAIYQHLSIGGAWEDLAGSLGLNLQQIGLYHAMISAAGNLPAKTFLTLYLRETGCRLRDFLRALISLEEQNYMCRTLAESLWNAALYGNSTLFQKMGHQDNN
ncbi:unnamed protein product [Lymnaea stagnalis]|uniref:PDZ domain-containing protein n=1 Tax=Lymnaea stagnalis TaxID=6523 RepID=A0AAV2H1H5_LYMST